MAFASSSSSMKTIICLLLYVFIVTTSAQTPNNTKCPFDYLHHFGDGVFDNGNAIRTLPFGPILPAARLPYGRTFPGYPTGRWCDGLLDIDYGGQVLGFPEITPYLSPNSTSANAIIYAVSGSTVLDRSFFTARNIIIPSYGASLRIQLNWFRQWLNASSTSPADRHDRVVNSIFLMGDVLGNDVIIALLQGKSIQEVQSYIPLITQAQINAARELIRMGATRIVIPGNAPMGCYPYVLTALASQNSSDYDDLGCLRSVNNLIVLKNNDLQQAIQNLTTEYPNVFIGYAGFYPVQIDYIRQVSATRGNMTLQACCGIGGKYNYDSKRFCGSPGVPVCSNPNEYIFWDGIHLTQEAYRVGADALAAGVVTALACSA